MTDLNQLTPDQFEQYMADLYQKLGYQTKRRGHLNQSDAGIDIEARRKREYLIIQCKKYAGSVSFKDIQALAGAVVKEKATKGVLATTGRFTEQSKQWIKGLPIELIDSPGIRALETPTRKKLVMPKIFNPLTLLWHRVPRDISMTEQAGEEIKRTNPQTSQLQDHRQIRRLHFSRQNPHFTATATVTNDFLRNETTIQLSLNTHTTTLAHAEHATTFHKVVIKQAELLAKFKIINR